MSEKLNLNDIDTEELGEIMMDKAESLQMELGDNIVIFEISLDDLESENFSNMEKMSTGKYGDWDWIGSWVSDSEIERIKNQFDEDLEYFIEDEDSDVDDYSQIYSSFLYCNGEYIWGGMSS